MNPASGVRPGARKRSVYVYLGAVLTAFALLVGTALPAAAAELMRLTFVRHGQSLGNASGSIDSSTPGPVLSDTGYQQAEAVAARLGDKNYDAVYASSMVRTQLTAAPMSRYLGLPITVLPGLQEIEAGIYEGTPESEASSGYMLAPLAWALQGDLDARIPGSIDGHEFDARMDAALQAMYDNGDRNAVVFSHGAAMMFWTFMNVDNLTAAQKMELLRASLRNTADVVIEGNAEDGWKLVSWDGREFSPERTFRAEVKLQRQTLKKQLSAVVQTIREAFATRDTATIRTALNQGISNAKISVIKYKRAVRAEWIARVTKAVTRSTPAGGSSSPTAVTASTETPESDGPRELAETPEASEGEAPEAVSSARKAAVSTVKATRDDVEESGDTEPTGGVDSTDESEAEDSIEDPASEADLEADSGTVEAEAGAGADTGTGTDNGDDDSGSDTGDDESDAGTDSGADTDGGSGDSES